MRKKTIIPQDVATQRLSNALRLRVGRGRRYSFSGLSDATGIATRTLESYAAGESSPSVAGLLSLCTVLGSSFASDVLCLSGLIAREGSADDPEHMRTLSCLTALSAQLAEAVEDGYVDHQEAAALQPVAQNMITLLEPMAVAAPSFASSTGVKV